MIFKNPEFTFNVHGMANDLNVKFLGIHLIANENALNQSLKSEFFKVHRNRRQSSHPPVGLQGI